MPAWLASIVARLHEKGFTLFGVADGTPYQEHLPDCQRAVVFAHGGRVGWDVFLEDVRQHPERLSDHIHPLDDFVLRCIEEVDPNPDTSRRWIQCADTADVLLDFRVLGQQAGLGLPSPVGLLIHPEYGLWVSLRMVLLTTECIPLSVKPSSGPCETCVEKPCIQSCPAGAVQKTGWSVARCAQFHQDSDVCRGKCHSRLACPIGVEHRHGSLQHCYHNDRSIGRKILSKHLKIADRQAGVNPHWSDWT